MARKSRKRRSQKKRGAQTPAPPLPAAERPKHPKARPRPSPKPSGRVRWYLVGLIVVTAAVYANALSAPFILDDKPLIINEPEIRPPVSAWTLLTSGRPVVSASLALNYALGELDVTGYHVFNILVHIVCGLLFFGFTRFTLRLPALRERYGGHADEIALVSSALFLLHPLQTEAVTYTIQRAEILGTGALIAGLWLAAAAYDAGRFGRGLVPLLAIGCFGMFSKEIFVVFPAFVLLYDWCFVAEGRVEAMTARWRLYAVATGIALVILVRGFAVHAEYGTTGFGMEGLGSWRYLTWQFGVLLYYVRVILWPDRLCFDCGYYGPWPVQHTPLADMVWLPFLALCAIGALSWWARARHPLTLFCVWGSAVALAPTSTFVPISDVYVEHRLYFPVALVALLASVAAFDLGRAALGRGWWTGQQARLAGAGVALAVCVVLGGLTIARNQVYADPLRLYQDSVSKVAENNRSQFNLANAYTRAGELEKAIPHFEAAGRIRPGDAKVWVNLGVNYQKLGREPEAAAAFETGIEHVPDMAMLHRNLAGSYVRLGRQADAIASAERAVELQPGNLRGRKLLGSLYAQAVRVDEALEQYRAGLRIRPDDPELRREISRLSGSPR